MKLLMDQSEFLQLPTGWDTDWTMMIIDNS